MSPIRQRTTIKKTTAQQLLAIAIDDQYLKLSGTTASLADFKERIKSAFEWLLDSPACERLDDM